MCLSLATFVSLASTVRPEDGGEVIDPRHHTIAPREFRDVVAHRGGL
jgi:hypothetical protein